MRVLIDIDGVCADFVSSFTEVAKNLGLIEKSYTTDTQKNWEFPFDVNPCWDKLKGTHNFWMTLKPLIASWEIKALNSAINQHEVYFVTTRPRTKGMSADDQTRFWLESIGVNSFRANVIATRLGSKGKLAQALDLEIAIDDALPNLENLRAAEIKAVSRRWTYNKGWDPSVPCLGDFVSKYLE